MLEHIIRETESHSHFMVLEFLTQREIEEINAFIDKEKENFIAARVGGLNIKKRDENIRGDYTLWLDTINPPTVFMPAFTKIKSIQAELNKNFFLGLKDFEWHLSFYPAGTFYRKHLDRLESSTSRAFSFVIYLHPDWSEVDGGELILYDKKGQLIKKILPVPGSLVGFMSEDFPHEVLPAKKERRSLTGWMHTKILN